MSRYYTRFRADLWTVNSNFENNASIISPDDKQLECYGTFRTKGDITAIIWSSEDHINNEYIQYRTKKNYTGVVLSFDVEYEGYVRKLSETTNNPPALVIETVDETKYIAEIEDYLRTTYYISYSNIPKKLTVTETLPDNIEHNIYQLAHDNIILNSVTVKNKQGQILEEGDVTFEDDGTWNVFTPDKDYVINYSQGLFKPLSESASAGGTITYSYYHGGYTINFSNLYAGSSITNTGIVKISSDANPIKVDQTIISAVKIMLFPKGYVEGNYTITNNHEYKFVMKNITVTGGSLNKENIVFEDNPYHICEGFDDVYYFTPRRLAYEMRKLGYKDWIDFYIGTSHFYEKTSTHVGENSRKSDGSVNYEKMTVLSDSDLETTNNIKHLNYGFRKWFNDYVYWLKEYDTPNIVVSISMECLQMPTWWRQKLADGTYAQSGWVPGTYFYSPTHNSVKVYLRRLCKALLDIIVENNVTPILQCGELWWWWQEGYPESISIDPNNQNTNSAIYPGQPPAFYDTATISAYAQYMTDKLKEENGADYTPTEAEIALPVYTSSTQEFDKEVIAWLCKQLGEYSDYLRSLVKQYENGQYTVLFFPPSVLDTGRVPEMMRLVNYPKEYWNNAKLDFIQLEDYDWVTSENKNHDDIYTLAYDDLNIDDKSTHYFGGYVQYPINALKEWALIIEAIEKAFEYGIPHIFVWAGTQVRRDNVFLTHPDFWMYEIEAHGRTNPSIKIPSTYKYGWKRLTAIYNDYFKKVYHSTINRALMYYGAKVWINLPCVFYVDDAPEITFKADLFAHNRKVPGSLGRFYYGGKKLHRKCIQVEQGHVEKTFPVQGVVDLTHNELFSFHYGAEFNYKLAPADADGVINITTIPKKKTPLTVDVYTTITNFNDTVKLVARVHHTNYNSYIKAKDIPSGGCMMFYVDGKMIKNGEEYKFKINTSGFASVTFTPKTNKWETGTHNIMATYFPETDTESTTANLQVKYVETSGCGTLFIGDDTNKPKITTSSPLCTHIGNNTKELTFAASTGLNGTVELFIDTEKVPLKEGTAPDYKVNVNSSTFTISFDTNSSVSNPNYRWNWSGYHNLILKYSTSDEWTEYDDNNEPINPMEYYYFLNDFYIQIPVAIELEGELDNTTQNNQYVGNNLYYLENSNYKHYSPTENERSKSTTIGNKVTIKVTNANNANDIINEGKIKLTFIPRTNENDMEEHFK